MTLAQFAGEERNAFTASLPAATTRFTPMLFTSSITSCQARVHSVGPPILRLMTCAGVGLTGRPGTGMPALQRTASMISASVPPQRPSARAWSRRAFQSIPAMPCASLVCAPATLATSVPCQLLGSLPQKSPGSLGSESLPSPSLALVKSLWLPAETKSKPSPGTERSNSSGWLLITPVSTIAMTEDSLPVVISQAPGACAL